MQQGTTNLIECQCGCGRSDQYDNTKKCWVCDRRLLAECYHRQWICWYCKNNISSNITNIETCDELNE